MAANDFPYLTAPHESLSMSATPAASIAGVSIKGVMMSETRELMMLEKAAPMTTATDNSMTFPLMAKALNSLIQFMREIIYKLKDKRLFCTKILHMKNYLIGFILLSFSGFAQKPFGKVNPSWAIDTLETSCGSCNFQMAKKGCYLAVKKDGQAYEVKGTNLDDHGDAHAADGFCMAIRKARVQGKIENGYFVASYFELMKSPL
jgi:hypothetical protein